MREDSQDSKDGEEYTERKPGSHYKCVNEEVGASENYLAHTSAPPDVRRHVPSVRSIMGKP